MVRINEHEKKFFEDLQAKQPEVIYVSSDPAPLIQPKGGLSGLRQARSIFKSLSDPHRAIAKLLVGSATNNFAFAKEGGIGAIGIFKLLNISHGESWWDWEPETIWSMLSSKDGIEATEEIRNIVMALQVVIRTNQAFENWNVFENVGQAFNMNPVSFGMLQPLELTEAALTIKILNKLRPNQGYEDEVHGYIAASARHAGVIYLPQDIFSKKSQDLLLEISLGGIDVYRAILTGTDNENPAVNVQKLKLKEIHEYIAENWEA